MNTQGTWHYTVDNEYGVMVGSFELEQSGEAVTGIFVNLGSRAKIVDAKVSGNRLSFNTILRTRMAVMMLTIEATIEGDQMRGMLRTPLGDTLFQATHQ